MVNILDADTSRSQAIQQNAVANAVTEAEIARQKVNDIYLHTWAKGIKAFAAEDSAYLCFVSGQDPVIYGDAVYSAKVMIGDCNNNASTISKYRSNTTNLTSKVEASSGGIYPNPNNGLMQANVVVEKGQSGYLSIYSIQGQKVADYVLKEGENNFEIDQRQINAGVYYYNITINDVVISSNKLVIVK